jgi:ketosteroid isomerase-like protein
MPSTSTHVVEQFYSAVAAGDLPTALAILGERVEWNEAPGMPYRDERPYRGATEVAERVLGPINADVAALTLEIRELLELGRDVAVIGRYAGKARASGRQVDQAFVHVWTLDADGGVERFRQHTDTERFAGALRV